MNFQSTSTGLCAWGEPSECSGTQLLANPLLNKGTAFTERERDADREMARAMRSKRA